MMMMKKTPPNQPNDAQTNSAKIRAARAHVRFCLATTTGNRSEECEKKCNAFLLRAFREKSEIWMSCYHYFLLLQCLPSNCHSFHLVALNEIAFTVTNINLTLLRRLFFRLNEISWKLRENVLSILLSQSDNLRYSISIRLAPWPSHISKMRCKSWKMAWIYGTLEIG